MKGDQCYELFGGIALRNHASSMDNLANLSISYYFSANLSALRKKDGSIRPMAVGDVSDDSYLSLPTTLLPTRSHIF